MTETIRTGVGVMADYAAISNGTRGTPDLMMEALSHLTRDDALFHCAKVNTIATGFDPLFSHADRQKRLTKSYCDAEQGAAINIFVAKHGGVTNVSVFFQGQILELARWVTRYCRHDPNDGNTFADPKVRAAFVRAALIASDLWNARVYGERFRDIDQADEPLLRAIGSFRKGMEESGQAEHTGTAMARGWLFFSKYLPQRLPAFLDLFEQATGMTVENYFTCAVALMLYTFPSRPDGPLFRTDHVADATAIREAFEKFIRLRGQTPEVFATSIWEDFEKFAYRGLRSRPIINFTQHRSAIMDPGFFTESVSITPLFDVFPVANPTYILGAFGGAFEDYILDFLREMFPTIPGLAPRLMSNVVRKKGTLVEFECDAILNDVIEAFVFEIKAAWIREDAILSTDHTDFVEQLRKKYGLSNDQDLGKEGRKGVAQLARSIGAIARKEWIGPNAEFARAGVLYPILVVHDQRLSYPGTATFLNQEFHRHLGVIPHGTHVHNLIVLTVSDVENLASSIEVFGFTDFLKDYSTQVPDRNVSVHNFLAMSSRYSGLVKPSKRLRETSDAIMDAIKRELFPRDGPIRNDPMPDSDDPNDFTKGALTYMKRAAPERADALQRLFDDHGVRVRHTSLDQFRQGETVDPSPNAIMGIIQFPPIMHTLSWLLIHGGWEAMRNYGAAIISFQIVGAAFCGADVETTLTQYPDTARCSEAIDCAVRNVQGSEVPLPSWLPNVNDTNSALDINRQYDAVRELWFIAQCWFLLHELQHILLVAEGKTFADFLEEELACDSRATAWLLDGVDFYSGQRPNESPDKVRGKRAMGILIGLFCIGWLSAPGGSVSHPPLKERLTILFEQVGDARCCTFLEFRCRAFVCSIKEPETNRISCGFDNERHCPETR